MAVLDFITKREARRKSEKLTAWGRYRQLLEKFVDGGEPDEAEAAEILQAAGKSEADLLADVETLEKRRQWAAQIKAAQDAQQRKIQAEADLTKAQKAINEAVRKFQPAVNAARAVIQAADHAQTPAEYAKTHLTQTVLDPEILQRAEEINAERKELMASRVVAAERKHKCNRAYYEGMAEHWRQERSKRSQFDVAGHRHAHGKIREYTELAKQAAENERQFVEELAQIDRRLEQTQQELDQLHARMLEP